MSSPLFNYPQQALFGRVLAKSKIYEHAKPSRAVRELFVTQINQITWQYKLAPETINLAARAGVPEIQVFEISLKTGELSEAVLRCIDKAIPYPIIYQLDFENKVKTTAAYKRPNDADASKWVVDAYFETAWLPADGTRSTLPIALDLAGLYEQLLRQLMPLPARSGESLKDHVARWNLLHAKQHEANKLESRVTKEKQFNRKVELNAQLRKVKNELEKL
jgi:Domain of unknown function (DUF4391)